MAAGFDRLRNTAHGSLLAFVALAVIGCPGTPDAPSDVDDGEAQDQADLAAVCGNGVVETGEQCDSDAPRACTTSCGSGGTQACVGCTWEACTSTAEETCNGVDDDCDGETDETFACVQGVVDVPCSNGCGAAGTTTCSETCTLVEPCCAPLEACGNGCDDDCDGTTERGACDIGTLCDDDAGCSSSGLTCNENWGICVIPDCAGRPDFTPCETITTADRSYDICSDGTCVSPGCGDASCNAPGPNWPLGDTGLRLCGDENPFPFVTCPGNPGLPECATTPFCGQDAQYGWDVIHEASERFTRTVTVPGEPIVVDNVTELVWQGCVTGRSGTLCDGGSPVPGAWTDALALCDELSWAGYSDWRLPDEYELESIVDYGRDTGLMIDPAVFPASELENWSSSRDAFFPSQAWFVSFSTSGMLSAEATASPNAVRCVRDGSFRTRGVVRRFTRTEPVSGNPIVADTVTGLVWQGCSMGQPEPDCVGSGSFSALGWRSALDYCQDLAWAGFTDWRLPDVVELFSIVDSRRAFPSIDIEAFPAAPNAAFWSSTSWTRDWMSAWTVSFNAGPVAPWYKDGGLYSVRCVRDGP